MVDRDSREEAALLLSEYLHDLAHDLRRGMDPVLRDCGLVSVLQVAMLGALDRLGPTRLVDLSRRLNVPTSTLSELTDRLVADGLVTRDPNPGDRRSVMLAVTPGGRARLEAVRRAGAAHVQGLLAHLDDTTVEALLGGLRRLREAATARRQGNGAG